LKYFALNPNNSYNIEMNGMDLQWIAGWYAENPNLEKFNFVSPVLLD
jgi:hypothetical protein